MRDSSNEIPPPFPVGATHFYTTKLRAKQARRSGPARKGPSGEALEVRTGVVAWQGSQGGSRAASRREPLPWLRLPCPPTVSSGPRPDGSSLRHERFRLAYNWRLRYDAERRPPYGNAEHGRRPGTEVSRLRKDSGASRSGWL